jgi:hypothetical protein
MRRVISKLSQIGIVGELWQYIIPLKRLQKLALAQESFAKAGSSYTW